MRIELLSFEGCPNADVARERIVEALRLERTHAVVCLIDVETIERAQEERFLGSPSVRVDGHDVEPGADRRTDFGLMCRTYGAGEGAPSVETIRKALRTAWGH